MGESQISPRYSQVQDTGESQISPRYSQVQDMGESQISSQVQDTGESQISPGYSQVQDTDESQICPEYSQVHKPAKDFRIDGNQGTEGEDLLYDRVAPYEPEVRRELHYSWQSRPAKPARLKPQPALPAVCWRKVPIPGLLLLVLLLLLAVLLVVLLAVVSSTLVSTSAIREALRTPTATGVRGGLPDDSYRGPLRRFPGDNQPVGQNVEDWCDTHEFDRFGDPVTHSLSRSGFVRIHWFKDPLPPSADQREWIWVNRCTISDCMMSRYNSYGQFVMSRAAESLSADFNPFVYNGKTFVQGQNAIGIDSKYLKINWIRFPQISIGIFHADEYGLWSISPNRLDNITLINTETLQPNKTWRNSLGGNLFVNTGVLVICGKLYTFDMRERSQRFPPQGGATAKQVFDTRAGRGATGEVPYLLSSLYGDITWATYNARERLVFGVDRGHLVTWEVKWKRRDS